MNVRIRWIGAFALACISLANISPAHAAAPQASCNNATVRGTIVSYANHYSNWNRAWLAMEYWDGVGRGSYTQIDSQEGFSDGWYLGTLSYTVSPNCVVIDQYDDGQGLYPYLFYVNPDGTGVTMAGGQLGRGTWAASAEVISKRSLLAATEAAPACTKKTLKGTYSTSATEAFGVTVRNRMTRWAFDGAGGLTYRDDIFVARTKTHTSGAGTYAVNPNCQVSIFYGLSSTPSYAAVVAPTGAALWWLNIENSGVTSAAKAARVSLFPVDNSDVLGL